MMSIITFISLIFIISTTAHLKDKTKQMYIGSALSAKALLSDTHYKTIAEQEFNCVTPEQSMKWYVMETERGHLNFTLADKVVEFGHQHGMKVRGHNLIWHYIPHLPPWLLPLEHNKTELHTIMKNHIIDEVTHFKGKLYCWDVLNEVLDNDGNYRDSIWYRSFGKSFVAESLRLAHSADPAVKLYINDYGVENINRKSNGLLKLVKELKAEGVPLHGVGFQAHLYTGQNINDLVENLKRFTDLGLEVAITELDIIVNAVNNHTLELQAQEYAKVYSACLDVPKCVGVTVWDYSDKYGYKDRCLWDKNLDPKPAVEAIEKILK